MNCPSCDGKNREDARFCKFCGTDLDTRCRMCGALLDDDARFCDACGTPAADPGGAAPMAAAARKVVTVMFADLSGSTALEERMDAESVRSILDRFYAAMRTDIERFGGTVVKFTGDGAMAAFGVPDVHEDDAMRAVDCALAMQEEIHQLADDLGLDVLLNIGINTGEVVVSETDDDVVGDSVNVAARLEGAASGGEILVGEETWRLTRATSRYEPVEPLTLKGKAEPVPAYRLLAVDERTADSAAAPFVGRQAELGRLLAAFQDAVDANAARLVTVIGSPGLGKTRLARELMSELSDVARVREARCDPAGSSTFAPIADALRAGGGMSETDSEEEIVAALAARLPDDDPDRDRVAQRAAAIFGVGVPGTTEETFWALRKIIEAAARIQPVVFVLDDIHWAEPLLLDLVEHLAEWIRDAPVLLVGTARPELRDLRPSLVEGGRASAVLALEGLDRAATAQLALNLLEADTLPDELLAKIPASTEGNPLFVRELVRMLVDDDVLRRTSDGWEVTVDVDAIQVPPTISSLLSARVDRLRNDERTVIELASVVGKEFYRGALIELAPAAVRELVDGCLESLHRKELVEPVGTYWIDEPVYTFHHALIQDAAYRRVLKERRAELHERVAGWLEVKTADVLGEHDELLGYHLEQAHEYKRQLGRPDDELGSRASELLGRAAQRALESDDLPAAATLSGRALECLTRSDERRAGPLLMRCEALLSMGDVAQGAAAVSEYDAIASTPRRRAWATCFHGQLATLTSSERLQETESLVAAAAAELTELGDQAGAAKAHTVHASVLAGLGRFAECEAVLDQALTAARAANDRRRITATLGAAPHAALWGPNPVSRAGGRCLDIVRLLRITTGSPAVEATSTRCQAVLEAFRGRADAARRMLGHARRTLSELGLEHELLEAEQFSGIVELVDGDAAAAEQHLRAAFEGFTKVGVDVLAAQSAARLARALLNLGEDEEAESFLAFAEQHGGQDLKTALSWRSTKAELLARRGEFADARALAEEAVAIAERTDALIDHGIACRSLGVVLRAAGDAAGAREAEARALALFERKGATALIESAAAPSRSASEPAPSPATMRPQNAATRRMQDLVELFARRAWDEIDAVTAPDCRLDDRRVGVSWVAVGASGPIDSLKAMADAGTVRIDVEPIATRGERLAVIRWTVRGRSSGGFETDILIDVELDERDRVAALVVFGLDELDVAIVELDRRFAGGLDAADRGVVRSFAELTRSVNARDWAAVRRVFADDVVTIDHRPASLGRLSGPDAWIESFKALVTLMDDHTGHVVTYHRLDQGVLALQLLNRGSNAGGGSIETMLHIVGVVRDGRIAHWEHFPIEDLEAALERFDELASITAVHEADTSATRVVRSIVDCFHRRDWTAFADLFSESLVREDRRQGLGSQYGRDDYVDSARQVAELGLSTAALTPLAWRGDSLVLTGSMLAGAGNVVQMLALYELGDDGRATAIVTFDEDDLDDAIADLDRRFCEGEGAGHADVVRMWARYEELYNARDWTAFAELLTDDFVAVDRRLVSFDQLDGPDEFIRAMERLIDLDPGRRGFAAALPALGPRGGVATLEMLGATADGAETTETMHVVGIVTGGRFARTELYPADRRDDALRRFEELSGARAGVRQLSNACTRTGGRFVEAFGRRAWDAVADCFSNDAINDDRRTGLRDHLDGRDAIVAGLRHFADLGATGLENEVVATRGDRLALSRRTLIVAPGRDLEAAILAVEESDDDGRIRVGVLFDPDDVDVAIAALDDRFIAREAAAYAGTWTVVGSLAAVYNDRDWSRYRAALSDDFVLVDHRPAYLGTLGPDEWIASGKVQAELAPDVTYVIPRILAIAEEAVAYQAFASGRNADGAYVEISFLQVALVREGRIVRLDFFPLDAEAEAIECFDELTTARAGAESLLASGSPSNEATRANARLFDLFARKDWDAVAALYDDALVSEDRRTGLRSKGGKRGHLAQMQIDIGIDRIDAEPLATRGDRLALSRLHFFGERFDAVLLGITEVTEDGLIVSNVTFDEAALDAAFAELDDRYLAHGGDGHDVWRATSTLFEAHARRDWDAVGRLIAEDIDFVDHRPASLGRLSERARLVDAWKVMSDLAPDIRFRAIAIERTEADLVLAEVHVVGTSTDGASFVSVVFAIGKFEDGRFTIIEFFDPEDEPTAIARFEELGPRDVLENAATRFVSRLIDVGMNSDEPAFVALHAPSFALDDRRAGLRHVTRGLDQIRDYWRAAQEDGLAQFHHVETIAVRGERLSLSRRRYFTTANFESEQLVIDEIDEQGLVVGAVFFDPDDLRAAHDELEDRYIAGEGRPFADVLRLGRFQRRAYAERNWGALRESLTDDVVHVDHQMAGAGTIVGADGYVEYIRTLVDLADMSALVSEVIDVRSDRVLAVVKILGRTAAGAAVEMETLRIFVMRDGRTSRIELFAADARADALARFAELGPHTEAVGPNTPLENACTRTWDAMCVSFAEKRWDVQADRIAEDVVTDDRRPGLQNILTGRDAFLDVAKTIASFEPVIENRVLAIRGDRLSLLYETYAPPPAHPRDLRIEVLHVLEVDAEGRLVRVTDFEPDDLDAAYDELDQRYLAAEGPSEAAALRLVLDQFASYNTRDWKAFAGGLADDHVFVDHRPASAGTVRGAGELVRYLQTLIDLAPDVGGRIVEIVRVASDRVLTRLPVSGRTQDGAAIEIAMYVLHVVRDGRLCRLETYPFEARDPAISRFDELGTHPDDQTLADASTRVVAATLDARSGRLESAAERAGRRFQRLFAERDWDSFGSLLAEHSVYEDRRRGMAFTIAGRDVRLQNMRMIVDVGGTDVVVTPVAVRGERLSLHRMDIRGDDTDFHVEMLQLDEYDADGLLALTITFDLEDADSAFAELEARYVAGEGAGLAALIDVATAFSRSINERRWDDVLDVIDDDLVFVDHRPASLGSRPKTGWVDAMAALVDVIPTFRIRFNSFRAIEPDRWWAHNILTGASADGAEVEVGMQTVSLVRDGKLVACEAFPDDALDAARAAYEALGPRADDDHPCVRWQARREALIATGDWETVAEMYAEDAVFEDHRSGLGSRIEGRDALIEQARFVATSSSMTSTVLATRGERLALIHGHLSTARGYEAEMLLLHELDSAGRQVYNGLFDPDDLDAAHEVLDERFSAGEGAPNAANWRLAFAATGLFNRRDFDAYGDAFTNDFVLDDHRPAGWGREEGGPAARVAKGREMVKLSPDAKVYITAIVASAPDALMGRFTLQGTSTDGNAFEIDYLAALGIRGGRVYAMDYYALDDEAAALARFEELRDGRAPSANAAPPGEVFGRDDDV